ncbi:MAG: recombinase family protein [Bacteroidetes bacterium]|nr:recombinase family protein [Bacteroidota bacterium]
MIIGYARVSRKEQNLNLQIDALKKAGCEKIYTEKISAVKERPEFEKVLDLLRKGDKLVVWKLDRLGRSLKQLVNLVEEFGKREIEFTCIYDNIDTSTPQGRLFFNMMASLAEYEREIIKERTMHGLEAAKIRGKFGGRPAGLSNENLQKAKVAKQLYEEGKISAKEIAKTLGLSTATLYRYLHRMEVKIGELPAS